MAVLKNVSANSLDLGATAQEQSAVLTTNKSDYAPTDTALITGTGFTPGATYTLLITSVQNYSFSTQVVADSSGNIAYAYQLDGTFRPFYKVEAIDGSGTVIATTTFLDGPTNNESANLDQCANKGTVCDSANPTQWVNGNLGQSKATYYEGDSVPYRLRFDNLTTTGSDTVTIAWDTTQSGKHAIDYVTTFNRTVTTADPCSGISGCGTGAFSATTFPIPTDPNVSGAGVTQIPGVFTLYGGTINGVSGYNLSSNNTSCDGLGSYSGNSTTCITITFTPSVTNPVLAWGGHIATRVDWGTNNSAVNIPGSPYHTRLIDLDGSGGNQDKSLSANAVIYPASITIIKDANPQGPTSFSFSASPLPLSNFSLVDNGTSANTQVFSNITNFTKYTVTENTPSGWTLSGILCGVTSPNGGTQTVNGATVTINLAEGENVTCTYTNTAQTGFLTVNKQVDTNGDGTYTGGNTEANNLGFTWSLDGNGTNSMGFTIPNIDVGFHSVNEDLNNQPYQFTGWYTTGSTQYSCTKPEGTTLPINVSISNNNNTNITLCNQRDTGTIQVKKIVDPADSSLWDFTISGNTNNTATLGNGQSSSIFTSETGIYTVSEAGHVGTTTSTNYNSSYVCTDVSGAVTSGTGTSASFNLTTGENVFCTFTNSIKRADVTVVKFQDNNANGALDAGEPNLSGWTIKLASTSGTASLTTDTTGKVDFGSLIPGNYTLSETLQGGWNQSNIYCTNNGNPVGAYSNSNKNLSLTVNPNDSIQCYIGNYQDGSVIVKKVVTDPQGIVTVDTTTFPFSVNGGSSFNVAGGSQSSPVSVTPGTSTVVETPNSNYTFKDCTTTDGSNPNNITNGLQFGVSSGQTVTVTCTNQQKPATIIVKKVIKDANGNVVTNDTQTFTVELNNSNPINTLSTSNNVVYNNVNPGGPYTITETGVDTSKYTPLGCTPSGFNLSSNQTETVTCTNQQVGGTISGYKYNSTGTTPIAGWIVNLYSCASSGTNCINFVASTVTNSLGFYTFTNLVTGFYQVVENLVSTYTPISATYHNVTINPGTVSTDNNFYNFKNVDITVCKVVDADGNLTTTNDQTPVPGWGMQLNVDGVASGNAQLTGSNGCYTFTNLGPGHDYSVTEENRAGWTPLSDPTYTYDFGTPADGQNETHTFINFTNGSISGEKFNDINGNGVKNTGEPGLSGWTIYLDLNNNGKLDAGEPSTTTDSNGNYSFTDLGPGTYYVREVGQPGWVQKVAPSPITLTSGQNVTNADFGNQGQGTITIVKNTIGGNDIFGFTATGPSISNFNIPTTSNTGSKTFSNTPAGTYTFNENSLAGWSLTDLYCTGAGSGSSWNKADNPEVSINLKAGDNVTCTFTNTQLATLKIVKNTVGGDGTFSFDTTGSGISNFDLTTTSPSNSDTKTFSNIAPGSYSVSENAPASPWKLTNFTCDNGDSPNSITLNAGQTVTCTFTNTKEPVLTVAKTLLPNSDTGKFNLLIDSNVDATDVGNGGTTGPQVVSIGSHTVSETAYTGTNLSDYNAVIGGDCASNGSITLAAGDNKTCTITNTRYGSVKIVKDTVGADGTFGFVSTGSGVSNFNIKTNSNTGSQTFSNLLPGAFSFSENTPVNWVEGTVSCKDNSTGGSVGSVTSGVTSFNLSAGQNITCTFNNTAKGALIIDKTALGGDSIFDYSVTGPTNLTPSIKTSGGSGTTGNEVVTAGTYDISEASQTGWTQTNASCSNGITTYTDLTKVPVGLGETVTCTFTNTKYASVSVTKFQDDNADGIFEATESALQGWTMTLASTSASTSQTTNGSGIANFTNLLPETYTLTETQQTNWIQSGITCVDASKNSVGSYDSVTQSYTFPVNAGDQISCNVGNYQYGSLTGYKWNDLNNNGQECTFSFIPTPPYFSYTCNPHIPNWPIDLYVNNNGTLGALVQTVNTDSSGNFTFNNIIPGSYYVCEELQQGWNQTYPNNQIYGATYFAGHGYCYQADVTSGFNNIESELLLSFGNHNLIPVLTITKQNFATGPVSPGTTVNFEITITATQSAAQNVTVTDLLPEGFHYNSGSYKVVSSNTSRGTNGDITSSISEPTYHSPGVWTLGNMAVNETLTLTYSVTVDGSQQTGTYYDVAWGQGYSASNQLVLANAVNPGDLNVSDPTNNFVGTDVEIVNGYAPGQNYSSTVTQEVLGASTYLPATGENTLWVILATLLGLSGLSMLLYGLKLRRKK